MKTGLGVVTVVTASMLLTAVTAVKSYAQARDHQRGFFVRLSGGPGFMRSKADMAETEFSGVTADANFAIGGTVSQNNALHITLWGWSVGSPNEEINGQTVEPGDLTLNLTALGAGLTHYFMPINLYISGSVGIAKGSGESGNDAHKVEPGIVLDLTIGKEWWASDQWGLGLAAAFGLHSVDDDDLNEPWKGGSVALRFSATYN